MLKLASIVLLVLNHTRDWLRERLMVDYRVNAYRLHMMTHSKGWWTTKIWWITSNFRIDFQRQMFDRDPFIYMRWIIWMYFLICFASNPSGVWAALWGFVTSSALVKWGVVIWLLSKSAVFAPMAWRIKKRHFSVYITPMYRSWGTMDFTSMVLNTVVRIANSYALIKALELFGSGMDPRLGAIVRETLSNNVVMGFIFLSFELYVFVPLWHYLEDLDSARITEFLYQHKWKIAVLGLHMGVASAIGLGHALRNVELPRFTLAWPTIHLVMPSYATMFWALVLTILLVTTYVKRVAIVSAGSGFFGTQSSDDDTLIWVIARILATLDSNTFWRKVWFAWRLVPTITAVLIASIVTFRYQTEVRAAPAEVLPIAVTASPVVEPTIPMFTATVLAQPSGTSTIAASATDTTIAPTITSTMAPPTTTVTATPTTGTNASPTVVTFGGFEHGGTYDDTNWQDPITVLNSIGVQDQGQLLVFSQSQDKVLEGLTDDQLDPATKVQAYKDCVVRYAGLVARWDVCFLFVIEKEYWSAPFVIDEPAFTEAARSDERVVYFNPEY